MDEAFAAGAFLFLKRTLVKAHERVDLEFFTFEAQFLIGAVVGFAVDVGHGLDGFLFASYAWVLRFGFCHVVPGCGFV